MREAVERMVQVRPAPIQTAEDARMAYLRKEITEAELKEILGRFGYSLEPTALTLHPNNFERVDDAFERSLPDVEEPSRYTLDERLKAVQTEEKVREAAVKATPKPKVEMRAAPAAAVDPNKEPREAGEKVLRRESK